MPLTVKIGDADPLEVTGYLVLGEPSSPPPDDPPDDPPPSGADGVEFSPTMTGPSSPSGYTASATSEYAESGTTAAAWKAFSKVTGAGWANAWSSAAQATSGSPQYLSLTLPAPKTCYTYDVLIRTDANTLAPLAWELLGYDSTLGTWTVCHSVSGLAWANGERKLFSVTSPASYSRYQLRITSSGILCQIDELRFFS